MGQSILKEIWLVVTIALLTTEGMNSVQNCTWETSSHAAGTETLQHYKCSKEVCLICNVNKTVTGLSWRNEISKEDIAVEQHNNGVKEKVKVNDCDFNNYSIRLYDACSQLMTLNYTCRIADEILQTYLLKEEVKPTLLLDIIKEENSSLSMTKPDLDLKAVQCIAKGVRLPIHIWWYINSKVHCKTVYQAWNYNVTTITSLLNLHKINEMTNVSCVVTGPFVSTESVSIIIELFSSNALNNYGKNTKYIILSITGVLFIFVLLAVQKVRRRFQQLQRNTSDQYETTANLHDHKNIEYYISSLDTSAGNIENVVYESYNV